MDIPQETPMMFVGSTGSAIDFDAPAIVGIDPSSKKLAIVVGTLDPTGPIAVYTKTLRIGDGARDKTLACLDAYQAGTWLGAIHPNVRLTALEGPVLGRGGAGATIPQAYTSGALQAGLTSAGLGATVHLVNNQHWKSTTVGNGHAKKEDIADWVRDEHREQFDLALTTRGRIDQDICDAIAIYHHATGYYRTTRKLHRAFRRPPARRLTTPTEGTNDGDTRPEDRSGKARRDQGPGQADASQGAIICGPSSIISEADRAAVEAFGRQLADAKASGRSRPRRGHRG